MWLGHDTDAVVELEIGVAAVAVVVLHKRPGLAGGSRAIVLSRMSLEALAQSTRDAALRIWWSAAGVDPVQIEQVRLAGSQALVEAAAAWLAPLALPLGKPVFTAVDAATLYFLPRENRLRMRAESTERPAAAAAGAGAGAGVAVAVASSRRIRVLIVDDSLVTCKLLQRVLSQDEQLEVVGSIQRPLRAEQAIRDLKPDVCTVDIHMEELSGVELTRRILTWSAMPIVIVSALSEQDGSPVFDALAAGAVDYVQKPALHELAAAGPRLCEKVRSAASAHVEAKAAAPRRALGARPTAAFDPTYIICIGSSTGGTEALKDVLVDFPKDVPPVLIVQHIPAVFSRSLAQRLDALCACTVKEAQDGEEVQPGVVLIAPGGLQMGVVRQAGKLRVAIADVEPVNRHKPSVDYLFASVAQLGQRKVAAAILTGMGADGAKGLLTLRRLGAQTLAQDEATCVVYGMPREAAKIGAAQRIVALPQVAESLLSMCGISSPS
ncbi:MAG: chemotaxis response regulator protein-glutamate methylesterase [Deltaproteobacteria bacterium]|nr:MAG: chemotaxis response regulator protein-glutamate methylesterase [Deltaproteobacteria bacterium]